jgi:hypothetical protein
MTVDGTLTFSLVMIVGTLAQLTMTYAIVCLADLVARVAGR